MKILVTGAHGYLGSGVVKELLDRGNEVVAVCHSDSSNVDKRATIMLGDVFHIDNPYNSFLKNMVLRFIRLVPPKTIFLLKLN